MNQVNEAQKASFFFFCRSHLKRTWILLQDNLLPNLGSYVRKTNSTELITIVFLVQTKKMAYT